MIFKPNRHLTNNQPYM